MSLDLARAVVQIDALAERLDFRKDDRARRLDQALETMRGADAGEARRKADLGQGRPYLYATPVEGLTDRYSARQVPEEFCVASVDGSHIDVDRHTPVRCYLINIGGCVLTYGSHADARLFSYPRLHSEEGELYITAVTPESTESVAVQGPLVGLRRAVEEVKALASVAKEIPPELPMLALIDGSLILWGLAGQGYRPFVRDEIIRDRLIPALDVLLETARSRTLAVAAYISLPQSTEVVNTLRLLLCSNDTTECRQHCSGHRSGRSPCDMVNGFLDRDLFQELLAPGERSCLYRTNSSICREFYGPHQVHFYYINTGEEIARVEVPQWVAMDEGSLELSHTLILDQCRRGMGYPTAIAEAHEQAVLTGQDRESFRRLMEDALARQRLPVYTSEKARSKRTRWL